MKISVIENLSHDHFDLAHSFPIVVLVIVNRVCNYQHDLDEFILPRWNDEVAAKIKPLAVRDWLYSRCAVSAPIAPR